MPLKKMLQNAAKPFWRKLMKLSEETILSIVVAVNGKSLTDARKTAETMGWSPSKRNKNGKTPDELFEGWYNSQRQRTIVNIVDDKARRESVLARGDMKILTKRMECSSPFYFFRDSFGDAMKNIVEEAQRRLDDAETLLDNVAEDAADETVSKLQDAVDSAESVRNLAVANHKMVTENNWFGDAERVLGNIAGKDDKNIGSLLDELNIRI